MLIQLSLVNPSAGDYSLRIYNVHPTDSGLYDCYKTDGTRLVGYYLVAEGSFLDVFENIKFKLVVIGEILYYTEFPRISKF